LDGVQRVISDSQRGLTNAVATVLQSATWQRCRVHCMRNALAKVSKGHAEMVAATIRTIFAQPTGGQVWAQVDVVADMLAGRHVADWFSTNAAAAATAALRRSPRMAVRAVSSSSSGLPR
jgi:transposase-like protein